MSSTESAPRETGSWSIRQRLGLSLTLAIGGVLALLFVALDQGIESGVTEHLDSVLANQARSVGAGLSVYDQDTLERVLPEYLLPGHTEFFTVLDADGRAILNSSNSRGQSLTPPPAGAALPIYYDLITPDRHRGRALAVPLVAAPDKMDQTLIVATERDGWDSSQQRMQYMLLGGIALATAVVVILALLLVQSAFRPLMRLGARIARLGGDQPPPSIGSQVPRELAPFAAAFDTGVGRLYQAIERERRFSHDIAHELRTPLAEIRASAESALHDGDPTRLRGGLEAAIAASDRMQRSVDTLLSLARYESGQARPSLDPLDLTRLLSIQVDALRHMAGTRRLDVSVAPAAEAWIRSDVGLLERIVDNLLQNAIEYGAPGSRITAQVETHDDGHWLVIENDAPDLDEDDVQRFGERFWRKQAEGGTARHAGLGLALATGLARTLGIDLGFELVNGRLRVGLGRFEPL